MRIAINPQINMQKPFFTSSHRETGTIEEGTLNRNTTAFFRRDLAWNDFADLLVEKYKNKDKVNIYCYACSDGSEPYSVAMLLISRLGLEGAKKFFPIIAVDSDDYYFDEARKGNVKVNQGDAGAIGNKTGSDYKNYKKYIDINYDNYEKVDGYYYYNAKVKDFVRNSVVFKTGDIKKDIEKLNNPNTVLMFRNAFEYFDSQKAREEFIKNSRKNLGKNSVFVIGNCDRNYEIDKLLLSNGFKDPETCCWNCYTNPSFTGDKSSNNPQYLQSVFIKSS